MVCTIKLLYENTLQLEGILLGCKKVVNLDLRMSFIWGTMFRVQVIWYIKIT